MPKKKEKDWTAEQLDPCKLAAHCLHAGEDCTDKGKRERGVECYEPTEVADPIQDASNEVEKPEEDGVIDASSSIPEVPETVTVDESGVTMDGVQEGFVKGLLVDVTPIQMGEYSLEMATLYRELKETEEDKKATAKSFTDRITRIEVRLDEISKILTEGTIEKPIQCQWQYDFEHGVKRLIRLDNHTLVDEKVLTAEEYQLDLNWQANDSVKNVNEAFQNSVTGEAIATENGENDEEQGGLSPEEGTQDLDEDWPVGDPPDMVAREDAIS